MKNRDFRHGEVKQSFFRYAERWQFQLSSPGQGSARWFYNIEDSVHEINDYKFNFI